MQDHLQRQPSPNGSANAPGKSKVTANGVGAAAILIWIAFLITMILLKGSDIGSPGTPQSALIATNERLLQMVQWTIGTVLTLGGALIGLNWYQGEKRYEHDRRVFEERLTALERRAGMECGRRTACRGRTRGPALCVHRVAGHPAADGCRCRHDRNRAGSRGASHAVAGVP